MLALLLGWAAAIPLHRINGPALDRARDTWLYALAWLGVALLLAREPAFGLIGAAVLLHWRSHEQLPALLTWVGIIATWELVQAAPPAGLALLPPVWRALAVVQVALATWQWSRREEPRGTLGQRSLLGAFLALALPFASLLDAPLLAWGLFVAGAWLPLVAAGAALAVLHPEFAPWLAGLALLGAVVTAIPWTRRALIDRLPRGGSVDSLRNRLTTWREVVRLGARWPVWLIGRGPSAPDALDTPMLDVLRVYVHRGHLAIYPFHNEPLECWYTYGLLGVAAMGALAWRLAPHLALGDPWTASAVAGLVLACGSIPCRVVPVGVTWHLVLAVIGGRG